jgi:hypothetical protein
MAMGKGKSGQGKGKSGQGKGKSEQAPMWVAVTDLPVSPGHPFYARLSAILDEAGFDRFAEEKCGSSTRR